MTAPQPPADILRQITRALRAAVPGQAPATADAAETARPGYWHVLIFPPGVGGPAFPPARPPNAQQGQPTGPPVADEAAGLLGTVVGETGLDVVGQVVTSPDGTTAAVEVRARPSDAACWLALSATVPPAIPRACARSRVAKYADTIMGLIRADRACGHLPATAATLADLHEYVKVNHYLQRAGVASAWADRPVFITGTSDHERHGSPFLDALCAEVNRRLCLDAAASFAELAATAWTEDRQ